MRKILVFLWLIAGTSLCFQLFSQNKLWNLPPNQELDVPEKWETLPKQYLAVEIHLSEIRTFLEQAPKPYQQQIPLQISLPNPDGKTQNFAITRSLTLPEELEEKYPLIRTFQGYNTENPHQRIRLELSPSGLHAMIREADKMALIEPHSAGTHFAYWSTDFISSVQQDFICETDLGHLDGQDIHTDFSRPIDSEILLYRMAIAGDQLYTAYHGGVAGALAAIAVVLNRVNGIYEREAGVQFQLIPNNDVIIFNGPDPYTQGDNSAMLLENQGVIDSLVGNANYDIGHVFTQITQGSVGQAWLSAVCRAGFKGRAVSGFFNPVGDPFIITAVAHEMGHQFGATHTFNTTSPICVNNRTASTAYEPGSGSTLMSYGGACPPQNVNANAEDYYHGGSLAQIHAYTRSGNGNNCPTIIPVPNQAPTVSVPGGGFFIPKSTPFELGGSASDPDGDSLTYCWEQMDAGPAGHPNSPVGTAALFRSFQATPDSFRVFPKIEDILFNTQTIGEILPDYGREMNFRLTVRDLVGGVNEMDVAFEVDDNSGPFEVLYPNDPNITWTSSTYEQITWDVANTNLQPVNCQLVNILLSTDGGYTFPHILAEEVPNTGSALIVLPEVTTTQGRVKVQAADNIFFDISNNLIAINPPAQPGFSLYPLDEDQQLCQGSSTSYTILTTSQLGFTDSVNLILSGLGPEFTATFSPSGFVPGDTITLLISGGDSASLGSYPLSLLALAPNSGVGETLPLSFTLVEPSALPILQGLSPTNLVSQGTTAPLFTWQTHPFATSYQIEIATSPAFGSSQIFLSGEIETSPSTLPIQLTEDEVYYWRVRPVNVCGPGTFGETQAFQTGSCQLETPSNLPIPIPAFGNPSIANSSVLLSGTGQVGSVRVLDIGGLHASVDELEMLLISPSGTDVTLFSQVCSDSDQNFNINFAEGGETVFDCPPILGNFYQPQGSFSAFDGEPISGPWTLRVRDLVNFDGGELQSWTLEVCEQAINRPELIVNQGLQTQQWSLDTLNASLLEATDNSSTADEIVYTVIDLPQHGGLLLNGVNLAVGDQFTQLDLDQFQLAYLNNGDASNSDAFRFDLRNSVGGWNGIFAFAITISENPNTSIADAVADWKVESYPNPVEGDVNIRMSGMPQGEFAIELYSIKGQLLNQREIRIGAEPYQTSLPMSHLSSGLYLLRVADTRTKAYVLHRLVVE